MRNTAVATALAPLVALALAAPAFAPGRRHPDARAGAAAEGCQEPARQQLRHHGRQPRPPRRHRAGPAAHALRREGRGRDRPHLDHDRAAAAGAQPPRPDPAHVLGRRDEPERRGPGRRLLRPGLGRELSVRGACRSPRDRARGARWSATSRCRSRTARGSRSRTTGRRRSTPSTTTSTTRSTRACPPTSAASTPCTTTRRPRRCPKARTSGRCSGPRARTRRATATT